MMMAGGPETEVFACIRRAMTLTRAGCGRLHNSCRRDRPTPWEGRAACLTCHVGAANTRLVRDPDSSSLPEIFAAAQPWFFTCTRCRKNSNRLIAGRMCVSCYNRHREVERGRNAKGGRPTLRNRLHPVAITVADGMRVRRVQHDLTTGALELMLGAIKEAKGPVAFGWGHAHG